MRLTRTALPPIVLVLAVAVAGCSGGSAGDDSGTASGRDSAPIAQVADGDSAALGGKQGGPADSAGGGSAALTRGRPAATDRAIAYVGELQVQVDDVPASSASAVTQVRAVGGTLFGQETSLADSARASLTFKVPPGQFERLLASLGELGEPLGQTVNAEDVTEQLVDLEARLRTARASLDRVRALLGRAGTIAEIVALEREVAKREADVESMDARLRSLEGRVEEATITLHLSADRADLIDTDDRGFLAGLRGGWDAFTTSLAVAATVLGAVLPFAALAAAVFAGAVVVRRRRTRAAVVAAD
ncbi:MAG TPA: DUF4349 domain-containing protein [Mycobacteriales bacterium]|nr:DUF4349 domain-containing protein [Mycobacteriales bacterium]